MADRAYRSDSSSPESRDPSRSPAPATASTQTHDGSVIPEPPRPEYSRSNSDTPNKKEKKRKADWAEQRASERQQRSGAEARQRADRLAVSVERSYSLPSSRRGSLDRTVESLAEEDEEADSVATGLDMSRFADAGVRGRRRDPDEMFRFRPEEGAASRPATPTEEKNYAQEYVPRPEKYHGGILGSLLKLYNDGGKDSGDNSGRTTPMTATPNPSPPVSQPPSRPSSAHGSPRERSRPSSGFFGYHRHQGSKSSLALNELMKSSSMFMAPGSNAMSGSVAEKIKTDPIPDRKKRKSGTWGTASPKNHKSKEKKKRDEKVRITKHIAQILSRHKYLVKLCRALMMYGAPTHRLEEYMTMSARVMEIEGQFLYIPGCMIISFDDSSTHTTEVKIVRTSQGVDLGKLRDVHELYKEVVHDRMGVDEATVKLDNIMSRNLKFNNWVRVPVYGLASACVAPFAFQGRFIDMPIAFLLGCILGWLQLIVAPNNELYANVFEITAAIITSFLARAFGSIRGGQLFCFSALAQSSIALILPGYMVLCSSLELQSHNLVAGSVRMVYAMIYTLFLGYGITIGTAIYGLVDREHAVSDTFCHNPLDRKWHLLFVPAFTLCLCVVNQAKWKQTPVMLGISLAGFVVNSYSSDYFQGNTQISNMLGALTVGILANLYSRLGRHVNTAWFELVDWFQMRVAPRFRSSSRRHNERPAESYQMHGHTPLDVESRPSSPNSIEREKADQEPPRKQRPVGYGLAAAAMLPAIFVQVPSGLAAGGSLLAGVTSADQITSGTNGTSTGGAGGQELNTSAFNVLFAVIQVAIGITVGLFLSALIVYPLGKRGGGRSGLLSFEGTL
ncbi:pheromone-regulated membrane protein [Verticillium alfalfae VaMs.102]|uniref:Pheromone-regulated membrane protein n=1 Tax=Verticillium alfalfae (strain VaMs.102 / ATCC MYA-4576 / FGSC 10136) TaxID=526221 RepID=C9SMU5_VERA1|nr:pheromone-regulated membrane protein [Verticillium alfalfae VaMs.102]EEY20110.1 pheromone-regulated membrane protein [Verticillium alfalfae VaMs.102]